MFLQNVGTFKDYMEQKLERKPSYWIPTVKMWTLTAAWLSIVVPFYYNAIFNVPLIITPKDQYVSTKMSHLQFPLIIYLLLQTATV